METEAEFNKTEALGLWEQGITYGALAQKYGYCKGTIEKYVRLEADDYKDSWRKHQIHFGSKIPGSDRQMSMLGPVW